MAKSRLQQPVERANTKKWLTTFNDMITLLMVFFVLIFSLGTIDAERAKVFLESFQNVVGLQSPMGILHEGDRVSVAVTAPPQEYRDIELFMEELLEKEGIECELIFGDHPEMLKKCQELVMHDRLLAGFEDELGIDVVYSAAGIQVVLDNQLLFDSGVAQIHPKGYSVLDKIIDSAIQSTHTVRVEGHTDDVPIATARFPSNWELSTARAVQVVRYIEDSGKISPHRLSAVGYGEAKPVTPNDTPENRARNRRVEFIIEMEETELK